MLFFLRIFRQARIADSNGQTQDIPAMGMARAWASFLGGLLLLIGSSRVLVWSASNIALSLGVSELVIGLTIVAVGTSLPELAASIASALKDQADMAIGAIVGSNMFNFSWCWPYRDFGATLVSQAPWWVAIWWRYFSRRSCLLLPPRGGGMRNSRSATFPKVLERYY